LLQDRARYNRKSPGSDYILNLWETTSVLGQKFVVTKRAAMRRPGKAGSFGKLAAFSFNGTKILTTSGVGMLVSDDGGLIDEGRRLASHAREPRPYYQHRRIG
jgi:dTDP-4-amino-4,6-dideoxygalactose transaminase